MGNTYDLQIEIIERSQAVSKKDKVEDSTVEEWLLKKIKTKGQKELKELLGQKTCDFTV